MYTKENIKFLRELTQSSQRTFDRMVFPFYSADTFITYKLENKKYSNPLPYLIIIANHFHISLDDLLFVHMTKGDLNKVEQSRDIRYFYINFNQCRKKNNFSLASISQDTGIPVDTIRNYCRFQNTSIVKLENIIKMACYFDCSLDMLLSLPNQEYFNLY